MSCPYDFINSKTEVIEISLYKPYGNDGHQTSHKGESSDDFAYY